jgi:predicted O-methyltransferase YrrM
VTVETTNSRSTATQADVRPSGVEGWLTAEQAAVLAASAAACPADGTIVEIGSFRGLSTIVLAANAPNGAVVVAIDPHAGNDRGPQQIQGEADEGQADHEAFLANIDAAGVRDRVRHVRRPSQDAHGEVEGEVDLLYIDGAHRYQPARDDIRDWGARVRDGGTLLIHDSFSSIGVTLALLTQLFTGSRFRYVGRSGSMTEYHCERLGPRARVRNALHQAAQLPWFARNVLIKVLIVAKLGHLSRYLGHREPTWPF